MKKVGILTFHFADNFGAVLQAYALQKVIKKLDNKIDVDIIDFRPKSLTQIYDHSINIKRAIKKYGYLNTLGFLWNRIYYFIPVEKRLRTFEKFRKKYLQVSDITYKSTDEIQSNSPEYDYYITGSDQVWNPIYIKYVGYSYFLDFVINNSKKIAYAASIAQPVEDQYINDYKKHINTFDYISIREKASLKFLHSITEKEIKVTLDPTFLIEKDEWDKIMRVPEINDKYILVYGIQFNDELIELANRISEETGLKIVSFYSKKYFKNMVTSIKYKAPDDFLGYLSKAELVLTNSFHGTVFSIIYNKPFYTVPHTVTGSRMKDLLETFELQDRLIYRAADIDKVNYDIDFEKTAKILEEHKNGSLNFIKKALDII